MNFDEEDRKELGVWMLGSEIYEGLFSLKSQSSLCFCYM